MDARQEFSVRARKYFRGDQRLDPLALGVLLRFLHRPAHADEPPGPA
jgi:hypothetical protein